VKHKCFYAGLKNIRSSFLKISDVFMKIFCPVQVEKVMLITEQIGNYKKNQKKAHAQTKAK